VELDPDPTFTINTRSLALTETVGSLAEHGVRPRIPAPTGTPAMLIFAEQSDGPAYRMGFSNFQVITRYNRSSRYAMAVHDLAVAIAGRMHASTPESTSPGTVETRHAPEPAASAPPEEPALVTPPATDARSPTTPTVEAQP
jgi:hypothetical protein